MCTTPGTTPRQWIRATSSELSWISTLPDINETKFWTVTMLSLKTYQIQILIPHIGMHLYKTSNDHGNVLGRYWSSYPQSAHFPTLMRENNLELWCWVKGAFTRDRYIYQFCTSVCICIDQASDNTTPKYLGDIKVITVNQFTSGDNRKCSYNAELRGILPDTD